MTQHPPVFAPYSTSSYVFMICQILKCSLAVKVEMPFSLQLLLNLQNISVFSSFLLHSLHSLVKVYTLRDELKVWGSWYPGWWLWLTKNRQNIYETLDVDDIAPCIFAPSSSCPLVNLKTMLNLDQKLRARQPYFRAIELHLGCNGLRATAQRGDVTCYKTSYFWALCQTLALTLLLHQSTFQLTALFHTSPFTVSFQCNYGASNIWLICFSF